MRDPGLQPERTMLAWNRTAMAVAVNAALFLRVGIVSERPLLTLSGLLLLAGAAAVRAMAYLRRRQLEAEGPTGAPDSASMAFIAALVLLCALSAAFAVAR